MLFSLPLAGVVIDATGAGYNYQNANQRHKDLINFTIFWANAVWGERIENSSFLVSIQDHRGDSLFYIEVVI